MCNPKWEKNGIILQMLFEKLLHFISLQMNYLIFFPPQLQGDCLSDYNTVYSQGFGAVIH